MARVVGTVAKDAQATRRVGLDWTRWLAEGEGIDEAAWAGPADLDLSGDAVTGSTTTTLVAGGSAGCSYPVECAVTTSAGQVEIVTLVVQVL